MRSDNEQRFWVQHHDGRYLVTCGWDIGVELGWAETPIDSWERWRADTLATEHGGRVVEAALKVQS